MQFRKLIGYLHEIAVNGESINTVKLESVFQEFQDLEHLDLQEFQDVDLYWLTGYYACLHDLKYIDADNFDRLCNELRSRD